VGRRMSDKLLPKDGTAPLGNPGSMPREGADHLSKDGSAAFYVAETHTAGNTVFDAQYATFRPATVGDITEAQVSEFCATIENRCGTVRGIGPAVREALEAVFRGD